MSFSPGGAWKTNVEVQSLFRAGRAIFTDFTYSYEFWAYCMKSKTDLQTGSSRQSRLMDLRHAVQCAPFALSACLRVGRANSSTAESHAL